MCGIAGILSSVLLGDAQPALAQMLSALRHRGPDDQGQFRSASGHAALAHARLSILDLSPAGHQPMVSPDGRLAIVFNGEIYNFQELRATLQDRGVVFRSNSDTEVVLRAYEAYGAECVAKLRGMFAFALWDERERTCLLARDPFGIKPLYLAESAGRLVFASEVRALLASGLVARDLDPQGLHGYFRTGSVPEPHTLLRNVRCLEAGHLAVWRAGRLETKSFWTLRFTPETTAAPAAVAATRNALLDSVRHHFISDVPVGVFVGGGFDSTASAWRAPSVARTCTPTRSRSPARRATRARSHGARQRTSARHITSSSSTRPWARSCSASSSR
jgi:asparagine synthase (glutamine-hydrolysing)